MLQKFFEDFADAFEVSEKRVEEVAVKAIPLGEIGEPQEVADLCVISCFRRVQIYNRHRVCHRWRMASYRGQIRRLE